MSEEEFNLIITTLRYIEFGISFIAGMQFGRLIIDIINRGK